MSESVLLVIADTNGTRQPKKRLDLPMQRRSALPELGRKRQQ
jgi:hypothetical protein